MANTVVLERVFRHKGNVLPDINKHFSVNKVVEFYSLTYPEMTNSHIEEVGIEGNNIVYEIKTVAGTKG